MQQWNTIDALSEAADVKIFIESGIEHARAGRWKKAMFYLGYVADRDKQGVALSGLYFSYLGCTIAQVEKRTKDGLALCETAVEMELWEPENWANLARVQILMGKRRAATRSIHQGLKFDAHNPVLQDVRRSMGLRRGVALPFLSRGNPINVFLGVARSRILGARSGTRS